MVCLSTCAVAAVGCSTMIMCWILRDSILLYNLLCVYSLHTLFRDKRTAVISFVLYIALLIVRLASLYSKLTPCNDRLYYIDLHAAALCRAATDASQKHCLPYTPAQRSIELTRMVLQFLYKLCSGIKWAMWSLLKRRRWNGRGHARDRNNYQRHDADTTSAHATADYCSTVLYQRYCIA